jgi:hypothetical protein
MIRGKMNKLTLERGVLRKGFTRGLRPEPPLVPAMLNLRTPEALRPGQTERLGIPKRTSPVTFTVGQSSE